MDSMGSAGPMPDRVVVVGSGIAGLATALSLAPLPVTVVTQAALASEAATAWAQGGIAAALGPDDAPELHGADTLSAGAGLCDPEIVGRVTADAPACIAMLAEWGVRFDRDAEDRLALGLEAAHSRRRVAHAGGDASGRQVLAALVAAARRQPSIAVVEGFRATEFLLDDDAVVGVSGVRGDRVMRLPARGVVLATGGVGGLYAATTNPLGAVGSGLVLAARAGALLRDLEFVQFHPTAMALGADPMPLATEAIRGEGAILIDAAGERFMQGVPGAELAPRDIVARAIWERVAAGRAVFLDARAALGERFAERFPTVAATCRSVGLDPARQPIPVRPAVHYHMGGVAVTAGGRSSVPGLWACGEVAATGLHGANRLASNSLLEAVAFARWVAADLQGEGHRARRSTAPVEADGRWDDAVGPLCAAMEVRRLMDEAVGVVRDRVSLERAVVALSRLSDRGRRSPSSPDSALAALLIAAAALRRAESRGAHRRRDHPDTSAEWAHPMSMALADTIELAAALDPRLNAVSAA